MKWAYFFELHRNVDHSKKRVMKWVYFLELYRNVDHSQTRLIGYFVHFSWPTHFPDTFPRSAEDVDFDIFGMAENPEFEGCVAQSLDLEN